MSTRKDVALAKLRVAARERRALQDTVTVEDAARALGVSSRRVRAFIKPECNCVIRKRRARVEPRADFNCPYCNGTGHLAPRLRAIEYKGSYAIPMSSITEFLGTKRKTGRPSIP